ncbi:hypothetical protein ACRRTK_017587 [Alexandromys fortis]
MLPLSPNKIAVVSARASRSALSSNKVPKTLKTAAAEVYPQILPRKGRNKAHCSEPQQSCQNRARP